MWLQQLGTSIVAELRVFDPALALSAEQQGQAAHPRITTFRELFGHASPPLPLLELAKVYAKRHLQPEIQQLPRPIAGAMYCLCLLAALARHRASISSLSIEELISKVRQLRELAWVDAWTQGMIDELILDIERGG
jgi:hypothetical protein